MKTNRFLNYSALVLSGLFGAVPMIGAQVYTGTVSPLAVLPYQAGTNEAFYGTLSYIAREGQILTPQVLDSKGNVIKQGDAFIKMDTRYWDSMVSQAQAALINAKEQVELTEVEYLRYKALSQSNAESVQQFQSAEVAYQSALNNYWQADATLSINQAIVEACNDYTPFEGIVSGVSYCTGPLAGWPLTATITQLNPIGISVKMSREDAKNIGMNTPVQVIPLNSSAPQGIFNGYSMLTPDGITFITENLPIVDGTNVINDATKPVLRNWSNPAKFYLDSNSDIIGVPSNSVVNEGDKSFVWRGKGQKTMQTDKGIDNVFPVEKIFVKPAKLFRTTDNFETIVALEDKGSLEINDVILLDPPKDIKDGQTVIYPEGSYLLMPGDQVKVIVGK